MSFDNKRGTNSFGVQALSPEVNTALISMSPTSIQKSRFASAISPPPIGVNLSMLPHVEACDAEQAAEVARGEEGGRGQRGYAALAASIAPTRDQTLGSQPHSAQEASTRVPQGGLFNIRVVHPPTGKVAGAAAAAPPVPVLANMAQQAKDLIPKLPGVENGEERAVEGGGEEDAKATAMSNDSIMSALAVLLPGSDQLRELQDVLRALRYDGQQELSFDKASSSANSSI